MKTLGFALLLALTFACASNSTPTTADSNASQLRDRDWKLTWLDGVATVPAGDATPSIRFGSDGRANGNTGCNLANGNYQQEGSSLTMGPLVMTRRACVEASANELERSFVGALEKTRTFRIAANELELMDESGKVIARLR